MIEPVSNVFPVDPADFRLPEALPTPNPETGEVVVVLAEKGARDAGWAADAVVSLARRWSDGGLRVLLADGDLPESSLHERLGSPNGEGVTDLILYGASPSRVALAVEGEAFRFVPAGTVVSDAGRVYGHPRWAGLLSAFRESASVLILYLPSEAVGVAELMSEGDRLLRLTAGPLEGPEEPGFIVLTASASVYAGESQPRRSGPESGAPDSVDAEGSTDAPPLASTAMDPASAAPPGLEGEPGREVTPEGKGEPGTPSASGVGTSPGVASADPSPEGKEPPPIPEGASTPVAADPTPSPGSSPGSEPAPLPSTSEKKRKWDSAQMAPILLLLLLALVLGGIFVAAWLGYLTVPGLPLPPSNLGPESSLQWPSR